MSFPKVGVIDFINNEEKRYHEAMANGPVRDSVYDNFLVKRTISKIGFEKSP